VHRLGHLFARLTQRVLTDPMVIATFVFSFAPNHTRHWIVHSRASIRSP
jgi:hypothetical protein